MRAYFHQCFERFCLDSANTLSIFLIVPPRHLETRAMLKSLKLKVGVGIQGNQWKKTAFVRWELEIAPTSIH